MEDNLVKNNTMKNDTKARMTWYVGKFNAGNIEAHFHLLILTLAVSCARKALPPFRPRLKYFLFSEDFPPPPPVTHLSHQLVLFSS